MSGALNLAETASLPRGSPDLGVMSGQPGPQQTWSCERMPGPFLESEV